MESTILGAILGAVFSYLLQLMIDQLKYARLTKFSGLWLSTWQPNTDQTGIWVREKLKIQVRLGKVKITSIDNDAGYQWKGSADIIDKKYLIGRWYSVKPGAHASGTLVLAMSPEGNFMFGCFMGPTIYGQETMGPFALGRNENDLKDAIQLLYKDRARLKRESVTSNES